MLVSWTQSTWLQQNLSFNPNHGNSSFDPPLACEILQCMFVRKNVVFLFCCNIAGLIFFRFSRFRSIYFYGAPEIQETSFSDVKGPINVISIYIYSILTTYYYLKISWLDLIDSICHTSIYFCIQKYIYIHHILYPGRLWTATDHSLKFSIELEVRGRNDACAVWSSLVGL